MEWKNHLHYVEKKDSGPGFAEEFSLVHRFLNNDYHFRNIIAAVFKETKKGNVQKDQLGDLQIWMFPAKRWTWLLWIFEWCFQLPRMETSDMERSLEASSLSSMATSESEQSLRNVSILTVYNTIVKNNLQCTYMQ
jgi:hypothetical protein